MTASRWKPGQSGNPRGRAQGTGEIAKLRASIAEHVPEIVAKLVELAKAGDAQAARLLLERVLPPVKAMEQATPVAIPVEGSLVDQGRAILAAGVAGDLAPGQIAQLLSSLHSLAGLVETTELTARIEALEQRQQGATK